MPIFFGWQPQSRQCKDKFYHLNPQIPSHLFKSRLCITTLVFIQTFIGSSASPTDCLTTTYRRRWNWNACGSGWTAACGGCRRESIYWRCHWYSELLWWLFWETPSIHQLGFVIRWLCTLAICRDYFEPYYAILFLCWSLSSCFQLLPAACFAFPSGQEKRVAVRWIDEKTLGVAWMIPGCGKKLHQSSGILRQYVNCQQLSTYINSP